MKFHWKRLTAMLLALTLLFSQGTPILQGNAVVEKGDSIVYDFNYQGTLAETAASVEGGSLTDGGADLYMYNSTSAAWVLREQILTAMSNYYGQTSYGGVDYGKVILNYKYAAVNINTEDTTKACVRFRNQEYHKGIRAFVREGDWFAFWLQTPTTGTYDVTLNRNLTKYGVDDASVYILSVDSAAADLNAAIETAITASQGYAVSYYKTGTGYNSSGIDGTSETPADPETVTLGQWTADGNSEHIVVFKANAMQSTQTGGCNAMYPNVLTLTRTDTPAHQEYLDKVSPVTAETVAKDAVFSAEAQVVYVGEVNGDDHMFIFMNDYKLLVYNLDTNELVDTQDGTGLFMQPRGAVMDSNGILWACGLGNWLYRYDPVAKTGEKISFSKSLFAGISTLNITGITVDENDTVYFGTANKGYYGKYDGATVSCISDWLDPVNAEDPDSFNSGYGGLIVRDGYIYSCLEGDNNADGNNTHYFVKFDIANQKIVSYIDVAPYLSEKAGQYRQVTDLGGNYVMLSTNAKMSAPVIIDISTMERVEFSNWEEQTGTYGFAAVADDGSVYVTARMDSSGMFKITLPATTGGMASVEKLFDGQQLPKLLCRGGGWATIDGESVLVTYNNNDENDTVEAVFYNVQTGSMTTQANVTKGNGSGNQLRSIATDPDRKNIYVGSYGTDRVAQYTVAEGAVTKTLNSYAEQTDSLLWYDGYLYAGNYSDCTITQVDVENGTSQYFFKLNGTMFDQYRAHALAAGDGKVFLGTVPSSSNNGGVLAWYDLQTEQTYVAAGPTAADVYTAKTVGVNVSGYEWTRAADGTVVTQLDVTGVIENQTINCMVYKDGLIYGTTSIYGGSGSEADTANAKLFVYDVEQMKVLTTLDLATVMEGFTNQIEWVDVIAEDPMVSGKFWGVVADTLFSFTFDGTAFSVTEELSLGKTAYSGTGNVWDHRNIIFDGCYMYVVLPQTGVYMVDRNDPQSYALLSEASVKQMAMGEDGNLYFFNSQEGVNADLQVLKVAQYTQPLVAASVQEVIDALPDAVTGENISQFNAAEKLYDSLLPTTQALVNTTALYVARPYQAGAAVYTNIEDAVSAAAQSGKQVLLTENATADSVLLTDGVTLDLNGFALTVDAFTASVEDVENLANGYVVDSSAGNTGMLIADREAVVLRVDNPDLPVYDTAAGGYQFFDYKLELHEEAENAGTGREKFWFKFHFYTDDTCAELDQDAYDLVCADGSNLAVSVRLTWQDSEPKEIFFGRTDANGDNTTDTFSRQWADDASANRWFYVIVSGLDKVTDGTLTVEPVLTVNGTEVTNGQITYEKKTVLNPDYGWSDGIS